MFLGLRIHDGHAVISTSCEDERLSSPDGVYRLSNGLAFLLLACRCTVVDLLLRLLAFFAFPELEVAFFGSNKHLISPLVKVAAV